MEQILATQAPCLWLPTIDGYVLTGYPNDQVKKKKKERNKKRERERERIRKRRKNEMRRGREERERRTNIGNSSALSLVTHN